MLFNKRQRNFRRQNGRRHRGRIDFDDLTSCRIDKDPHKFFDVNMSLSMHISL